MSWASAAIADAETTALADTVAAMRAELGDTPPDLCCLFVAGGGESFAQESLRVVRAALCAKQLVGCGASGVLGRGRELEGGRAIALIAGHMEGVGLRAHYLAPDALRSGALPDVGPGGSALIFADPMTCPGDLLMAELGRCAVGRPVVGGLGGSAGEDATPIFVDCEQRRGGCVMLEIGSGAWTLDTIVAQGCRPIGQPAFVTAIEDHWVRELDGRPALDVLRELARDASERDRELLRHSLFLGIEMHPQRSSYGQGDFLVRNLVGIEPEIGALAVAGAPKVGQVVQFQLRDAAASAADLEAHLSAYARANEPGPEAVLLCSCVGRGQGLYGEADHDSRALHRHLGPVPVGGFFGNGEIGPVGGQTFLHAYTSAFGMFRRVG